MKNLWILSVIFFWILFTSALGIIFFWWWFGMINETPWNKLTEVYLESWDYEIWKQKWFYNICNKKDWCLNWEILWLEEIYNDTYIYVKINYWSWYIIDKNNEQKDFYRYRLYSDELEINNLSEIPKYWYLSNNKLIFYSENELKNLSEEQQIIFKELETKPRIIINWINYSQ